MTFVNSTVEASNAKTDGARLCGRRTNEHKSCMYSAELRNKANIHEYAEAWRIRSRTLDKYNMRLRTVGVELNSK